ncbi:hypothetical protein HAX54_051746, partial [Datura stramonium]|nr:hypothetical protein [Datura stramonium]
QVRICRIRESLLCGGAFSNASSLMRAGFWAHRKMKVGGGCFSARLGGRVAIVARVSLPTRLDARFYTKLQALPPHTFPIDLNSS